MPNQYIRISNSRGKWSQIDLSEAIKAVRTRNVSVRQASLEYGVPRKTLERRLKTQNFLKGPMGPSSVFGSEHEKRLVKHILKMQNNCFPLTPKDLRSIAFYFAEQLGIKHSFNKDKEEAGYVWLNSFLKRNPEIRTRKAEGVSLARCQALNRSEVNAYFDMLHDLLEKYELFNKPSNIFNMDESGLQLNNRPGHVLAKKGSKAVSTVTSTEKGETITVIGCCNAEGIFLPPACIMKGKNKKQEWQDGMPPGSVLYMSQKSAYINAKIFFEWLKTHFLPRKPSGTVLLCLDGHTSHCNSVEMLEFAAANDICLFTLPSHTTHYLQTLDRSVFKSLKTYYYEACRMWLKLNPGRRLTRLQFGELLSTAWSRAATYDNAVAGFKATGIYPFNRFAVPDHAFAGTSMQDEECQSALSTIQTARKCCPSVPDVDLSESTLASQRCSSPSILEESRLLRRDSTPSLPDVEPIQPCPSDTQVIRADNLSPLLDMGLFQPGPSGTQFLRRDSTPSLPDVESMQPSLFGIQTVRRVSDTASTEDEFLQRSLSEIQDTCRDSNHFLPELDPIIPITPKKVTEILPKSIIQNNDETPSKFLNEISPIPLKAYVVRKRAKQVATILTSEAHINYRKDCDEKKNLKQIKSEANIRKKHMKQEKTNRDYVKKNKAIKDKPAQKYQKSNNTEEEEQSTQNKNSDNQFNKENLIISKKQKSQRQVSFDMEEEDQPSQKKIKQEKIKKEIKKKRVSHKKKKAEESTDTENENEPILLESGDSSPVERFADDCVGCGENYYETQLIEDWVQCIICKRWAHENCTEFDDKCHPCGQKIKLEARKGKGRGKKTINV